MSHLVGSPARRRLLILGATGRIGAHAVQQAITAGHEVVALVRDIGRLETQAGLTAFAGDIRDADAIGGAVARVDAVIAALGPRLNTLEAATSLELGMSNLVAAMREHNVPRIVSLSGAGVDVPGDAKPALDRLASWTVRRIARYVVEAKQREYEVLASSDVEWTALRPPIVIGGAERGYRLSMDLRPGARVTRADVGRALVDEVADRSFLRAAPFVLPASKR